MTIQTGGFSATAARPGLLFGAESKKKSGKADGDAAPPEDTAPPAETGDEFKFTLGEPDAPADSPLSDQLDLGGLGEVPADEPPADAPPEEAPAAKKPLFTIGGLLDKARVLVASLLGFENPELTGWIDILVKGAKMFVEKASSPAPTKA